MAEYVYRPKFTDIFITPNPAAAKASLKISVSVTDEEIDLVEFVPRSGEIYSNEVD